MTIPEAKEILSVYRPDVDDPRDPRANKALELARQDAHLKHWYQNQAATHALLRQRLRSLPVPAHLKANILNNRPPQRPDFGRSRVAWMAAAAALVVIGLVVWFLQPKAADRFDDYRQRVVRGVIRQYTMDVVSPALPVIRAYFETNNAPHAFAIPPALHQLTLTGAGSDRWRNHPVSMVCFERPNKEMLFLFVLDREAVSDPPPPTPVYHQVHKFYTASWTEGNHAYILAGTNEAQFEQKYLGAQ